MIKKNTFQRKIPLSLFLILLVCISFENQAQSVKRQCISSYGTILMNEKPALMQTVGQSYNTTASIGNTVSVLQGFQQPIVLKVEIEDSELLNSLNLNVYPNPATFSVTLQSSRLIEKSIIRVTDFNGRLILSEQVNQLQTYDIDCDVWENGIYIITVSDNDQNISSLKLTINK